MSNLRNGYILIPDDFVNPWTALAALAVKKQNLADDSAEETIFTGCY